MSSFWSFSTYTSDASHLNRRVSCKLFGRVCPNLALTLAHSARRRRTDRRTRAASHHLLAGQTSRDKFAGQPFQDRVLSGPPVARSRVRGVCARCSLPARAHISEQADQFPRPGSSACEV